MILTDEMKKAIELIETTNQPIYITGKAGTGKTTLLRHIVKSIKKKFVIAAPTGVAAVNAGGVTLHSLFTIPFGIQDPNQNIQSGFKPYRKKLICSIDALIIDEISMVKADTIDYIDQKLRLYRNNDEPFGGIQVIMFGDLYQLPPVLKSNEKNILLQFYRGPYFFYAHIFKTYGFQVIELNHVFRQSDERFINILNHIRSYRLTEDDIEELEQIRNRKVSEDYDNKYVHICSLKRDVQRINQEMLGVPTHSFIAEVNGDFDIKHAPCDEMLLLRVGARVMVLINDQYQVYVNGSLGNVTAITDDTVTVLLDNGCSVAFQRHEWDMNDYQMKGDKIEKISKGTCKQFPLTLAWAITIHKSQGLTFEHVAIHSKSVFTSGQIYVALSRCTSLEGIATDSFIGPKHIWPDKQLIAFEKAYKENNYFFDKKAYRLMKI